MRAHSQRKRRRECGDRRDGRCEPRIFRAGGGVGDAHCGVAAGVAPSSLAPLRGERGGGGGRGGGGRGGRAPRPPGGGGGGGGGRGGGGGGRARDPSSALRAP